MALSNPSSPNVPTAPGHVTTLSNGLYPSTSSKSASPVAANPSQLSRLSTLLAQGQKKEAAEYAIDHGLWSHALVISSAVGAELWKDTVMRFTAAELSARSEGTAGIRASYALIGGMSHSSCE